MGTKNNPGPFDCHAAAAPDEPMFILLARDKSAPKLVREWVRMRRIRGGADEVKMAEALACADAMEAWIGPTRLNAYDVTTTDGIDYLVLAPNAAAANELVMREEPEPTEEIAKCTEISEAKQRAQMIVDEDGELATRSLWDIAGDGGDAYILTCSEW